MEKKNILICPEEIASKNDNAIHFITAMALIQLYKLNSKKHNIKILQSIPNRMPTDIQIREREITVKYYDKNGWIFLYPLYDGNYEEVSEKLQL